MTFTIKSIHTYILNVVRTTRYWNNIHQVCSKLKDWKAKYLKVLEAIQPQDLKG